MRLQQTQPAGPAVQQTHHHHQQSQQQPPLSRPSTRGGGVGSWLPAENQPPPSHQLPPASGAGARRTVSFEQPPNDDDIALGLAELEELLRRRRARPDTGSRVPRDDPYNLGPPMNELSRPQTFAGSSYGGTGVPLASNRPPVAPQPMHQQQMQPRTAPNNSAVAPSRVVGGIFGEPEKVWSV
jgi:hypothetical protein